jgi:hypothetical protein
MTKNLDNGAAEEGEAGDLGGGRDAAAVETAEKAEQAPASWSNLLSALKQIQTRMAVNNGPEQKSGRSSCATCLAAGGTPSNG